MIEQLKGLQQFLIANKMEQTLKSLRAQILGKYSQAPSQQFLSLFSQSQQISKTKKGSQNQCINMQKRAKADKAKNQQILQSLLSKIAYSSKILQDPKNNMKINKLMGNKIFQKSMNSLFPETQSYDARNNLSHNIEYIQSQLQFRDELELIEEINAGNAQQNQSKSQIQFSNINIVDSRQSSIISQPSLVLQQLSKNQVIDQYSDDNDLGYFQYKFRQNQLINGCSKLTRKYGYPQRAVIQDTKIESIDKKQHKSQTGTNSSKFPNGVQFPPSHDLIYPSKYNQITYDVLKMKIIFDRQKTGYEQTNQLNVKQGDTLAGRYRVEGILGSGVFAKVLKVTDLIKNQLTCLKMISNNKDFFDQSLDQIKLLRYISTNCNPDEHNLLKFKNVFYHRQHLFIETDLLKDNLFVAYRKNPSFFSIPVLRQISRQILQALTLLHKLHIIHADLKPQNILIKSYSPIKVKIVDMGNSCFFHDHLGQYVQSRSYRAPQVVLQSGYNQKIDIWSVGCILAELWTKNVLFYNLNIQGMLARIQSIMGPWPEWMLDKGKAVQKYFSNENLIFYEQDKMFHILIPKQTTLKSRIRSDDNKFLSFLEATLKIDPNLRLSSAQALEHPFLKN